VSRYALSRAIVEAAIELQVALVARELAKQAFLISTGALACDRQSFAVIPLEVRLAGERVSKARIALDLALLEDA